MGARPALSPLTRLACTALIPVSDFRSRLPSLPLSCSVGRRLPVFLGSFSGRRQFRSRSPAASGHARVPLLARSACVLVTLAPTLPAHGLTQQPPWRSAAKVRLCRVPPLQATAETACVPQVYVADDS